MFKSISKIPIAFIGIMVVLAVVIASCTDLTENINDGITSDQFFQTDEEFISALGDAYGALSTWGSHNGYTSMLQTSSDEGIITQKGTDWFDGGIWIRMKRHTYLFDDAEINNAWTNLFAGVNSTNRLIFQFQSLVESGDVDAEQASQFISELRVMRAFYYYLIMDGWGNVPLITSFEDAPEEPANNANFQQGRTEVFNFIESEILENIDDLSRNAGETYGRMNKWVAHMLLAKLYLNAEVYTGEARWDEVVTQTDSLINSGNYSLLSSYAENFATNNSGSPELIFVVPYDQVFLIGFNLHQMTLHYSSQATFNLQEQPWNGYAAMEESYMRYTNSESNPGPQGQVYASDGTPTTGTVDSRLTNFFVGPQFSASGERLVDPSASQADPDGPPLTFTPQIFSLEPNALRQSGARVGKFEIEAGAPTELDNDYPIFRYADVLLMKAEALWRMNQNTSEALRLVNMIRQRADVAPFNSLTAQRLIDERGREMFWEMTRRQDLIRFEGEQGATRFNDPWQFKDVSEPFRNVFPIPRSQLEANSNLNQNPGYEG